MSDIPADEVLPCGCFIACSVVNGVNTLTVSPCRPDCVNLRNLLGLAAEKPVPVSHRVAP